MTLTVAPELITFRDYAPTDEGFVYSTWLKGLRDDNPWFAMIPRDTYFRNYHRVLDKIMSNPETRVRVVALKDDPDVILAYVVLGPKLLHWIHTRYNWTRMGLACELVREVEIDQVTHMTKLGSEIKPKGWAFNPFAI